MSEKLSLPSPGDMMRQTKEMEKLFEAMVEHGSLTAKLMRSMYESLVDTGFQPNEALDIVKARGWNMG